MTVIGASRPSVWATTSTRMKALAPTQPDLVDAGFLVGMLVLALIGFRTTFDTPVYLAAGVLGILLGVGLSHVANVLRQPIVVIAGLVIAAYFLVGGFVGARERLLGGVVPTGSSLSGLSSVAIGGWKDLLTTLPPVDGTGQLVVLPYLLGLLGGTVGFTVARRTRLPWVALLTPLAVSGVVILLGTRTPAAALPIGIGTAVLAAGWVVVRSRRLSLVTVGGSESAGRRARVITGAALVSVAAVAAAVLAPALAGTSPRERVVLRAYVEPPFDPSSYPSPVAGFRKYTEGAKLLWDQTLLSVSGLPAGTRLRFATLDAYSGTAWAAGNSSADSTRPDTYQRVGTAIEQPAVAEPTTYTVTVEAAYAAVSDLNVWLPSAGPATRVEFTGGTAAGHAASLRYNLALGQGIVPDRLRAGDVVQLSGGVSAVRNDGSLIPGSGVLMDASSFAFLAPQATKWSGGQGDPWAQLMSVAKHLKLNGAYSDGTSAAEAQYLPGHGVGRLLTFANVKQPVGNDEQYAAVFALVANQLGVPARLVIGASVPDGGAVRGQDVHVWVEVLSSDGSWVGVPETVFMPDRTKKPDQQEPLQRRTSTPRSCLPRLRRDLRVRRTRSERPTPAPRASSTPLRTQSAWCRPGSWRQPGLLAPVGRCARHLRGDRAGQGRPSASPSLARRAHGSPGGRVAGDRRPRRRSWNSRSCGCHPAGTRGWTVCAGSPGTGRRGRRRCLRPGRAVRG